ncbi:MAG: acyl-CoA dehydrogenase family protein [Actinomycetota bacterium]|nr:acyl-CoA dehydrogenase family protein [Actinomycetota bacterium]
MTTTDAAAPTTRTTSDPIDELRDWLRDNWDPDLSVAQWWELLGVAGWSNPILPVGVYGRGLSRGDVVRAGRAIAEHGALGPPAGLGLNLAAPTIATHGTPAQIERYVRDIVTGQKAWCQLFSEPGAGSDLAGLATRAERDGDVWMVNGQKVWTSGGHLAGLGMLIARTNPTAPKHQGITWFACDMHQPGVEVRPLKEMTGATMFSEVFLTDAVVGDDARIGDAHDGWSVANTTLAFERSGMGAGGDRGRLGARPGTVAGDLDKRAGDFVRPRRKPATSGTPGGQAAGGAATPSGERRSPAAGLVSLARELGRLDDPTVRDDLVRSHILSEVQRYNTERHKAVRAAGGDIPGLANFSKLLMADILRHNRDLSARILGARATLHAYPGEDASSLADAPGGRAAAAWTTQILGAQALPIYGGTDQIQRNIVAERALGLPKEPGDLARVPFNELPKNG